MSRRLLPWAAVLVLVVAVLASAGFGDHPSPPRRDTSLPAPSPSESPQPAIQTQSAGTEARRLVGLVQIRPDDLPRGYRPVLRREPLRAGWLGVCGGELKGSDDRVAVHQVAFRRGDHSVRQRLVVLERGVATRVLAELRRDAIRCTRAVPPRPVEQPSLLALRVQGRDPARRTTVQTAVLRSGDLLSVVSVDGDRSGDLTLRLARVVSARILFFTPTPETDGDSLQLGEGRPAG